MSPDEQIKDVLHFFADHTHNRPLIYNEIAKTANRWDDLTAEEKLLLFERCRRRFSTVHPTLVEKDRVKHARETLYGMFAKSA
ncbi:MAG: hypothetical protein P4L46_06910 [Fimbriimonas sp.]|nr:hypothetical protein [Fimbriimonas sp.]